jgi:hypothetical protein
MSRARLLASAALAPAVQASKSPISRASRPGCLANWSRTTFVFRAHEDSHILALHSAACKRGRRLLSSSWSALPLLVLGAIAALYPPHPAHAQNAAFQGFFEDVCAGGGSPTGNLSARCGDTPGGGGDLSGDSESSLNPSQIVTSNESGLLRARNQELRERLLRRRAEVAGLEQPPRSSQPVRERSGAGVRSRRDSERTG